MPKKKGRKLKGDVSSDDDVSTKPVKPTKGRTKGKPADRNQVLSHRGVHPRIECLRLQPETNMLVDPRRIRFQYSKIRPLFSGCGRSVESTLVALRSGETDIGALPMIQVSKRVLCSMAPACDSLCVSVALPALHRTFHRVADKDAVPCCTGDGYARQLCYIQCAASIRWPSYCYC